LGKSVGKDRESGKQTYVRVFGLERAKEEANRLAGEAITEVEQTFGREKGIPLISLIKFIVERNY